MRPARSVFAAVTALWLTLAADGAAPREVPDDPDVHRRRLRVLRLTGATLHGEALCTNNTRFVGTASTSDQFAAGVPPVLPGSSR